MEVSKQTRELIASNEALAKENMCLLEDGFSHLGSTIDSGFDRITYELQEVSEGINKLNSTFHWGFAQMISNLGRMNDSISELIEIAKSPGKTAAYEQFEIAKDAFKKQLYPESLEAVEVALNGGPNFPGYKLEWRFHQLKGTLFLGSIKGNLDLLDLPKAEESFLQAARYAKNEYPADAGSAMLAAGWAAFCQKKLAEALSHTEKALELDPKLGEAIFQLSKVLMALGDVEAALPKLAKAIEIDHRYAIKAADDGDFQKYAERFKLFIIELRNEKFKQSEPLIRKTWDNLTFLKNNSPSLVDNKIISEVEKFLTRGKDLPLWDIMPVIDDITNNLNKLTELSEKIKIPSIIYTKQNIITKIERTGRFFKKQERVNTTIEDYEIIMGIYDGYGNLLCEMNFIKIPKGELKKSFKHNFYDDGLRSQVERIYDYAISISGEYYIAIYPVTQKQWQAVMGTNPSHFPHDDHPIENVSWNDCQDFLNTLNITGKKEAFRLPTDAEWEFACCAGDMKYWFFGNDYNYLSNYAWYQYSAGNKTHPVGEKKPNPFGLYDMYGNVSEWCQNWFEENYALADIKQYRIIDPQGPSGGKDRVIRGGNWASPSDETKSCFRSKANPDTRNPQIGFRLVLELIK